MDFDFDIEQIDFDELYQVLNDSFKKKDFDLRKKNLDQSILSKNEIQINDVKEYFDFDVENDIYTFPYIDERELRLHTFEGMEVFPMKKFYWYIDSNMIERFFGLIDIEFTINKISLKRNDERFDDTRSVFKDVKSFYYDYEKEKYIQINKNGDNEFTKEYLKREEKYYKTLLRIENEMMMYLSRLERYRKIFTSLPSTLNEYKYFYGELKKYAFLESKFLALKAFLKHIDINHYRGLKNALGRFKTFLGHFEKYISNFSEKELHLKLSDFNDEFENITKINKFTQEEVSPMFQIREVEKIRKSKNSSSQGYFSYGSKVYENFVYLEFENLRKKYPDSEEMRKKEKLEIEKSLKNTNVPQKEESILTNLEWEELRNIDGSERRVVLAKILNKKISRGIISQSEKSLVMEEILLKMRVEH